MLVHCATGDLNLKMPLIPPHFFQKSRKCQQFFSYLSKMGSISLDHISCPSRSITSNNEAGQTLTSTRLISNVASNSITAPMARKVCSGDKPHTARSISDHSWKEISCTSEPKTTTLVTWNCSRNKRAARRATSHPLTTRGFILSIRLRWRASALARYCASFSGDKFEKTLLTKFIIQHTRI